MRYSIGEFADLLGVTVDTLRLYEKHNIITSIRDDNNHYRYFDDLDARNLLMSRWYRSMGIPLKDVRGLINDSSLDKVVGKLSKREADLEEEIRKNTLLLNKIAEINQGLAETKASINVCQIKKMPGIYRLKQTNINHLIDADFIKGAVGKWMNMLPYIFYSFEIEREEMLAEEEYFDYSWGLAISEEDADPAYFQADNNMEYIAPKLYLSSVIFSETEDPLTRKSLKFMIDYLAENHYSIQGDIIGKIIFTGVKEGVRSSYLDVNIPI